MVYYLYQFEFDPLKSISNREKHGIDFEQAKQIWDDPHLLQIEARTLDERRYLVVGMISQCHWSAIVTFRAEKVRIISVRRARKSEINLYEKNYDQEI